MTRRRQIGMVLAVAIALAGCVPGAALGPVSSSATRDMTPEALVTAAKAEYGAGHFQKAQGLAAQASKAAPDNAAALLVEAAALDRMKAFEKSDAIYRRLFPAIGQTAAFNNNYGYSMMLRGNLAMARKYLLLAQKAAPASATVTNNIDMLRNAGSYQRSR
jgi:Flp pilus assembly protein TadD